MTLQGMRCSTLSIGEPNVFMHSNVFSPSGDRLLTFLKKPGDVRVTDNDFSTSGPDLIHEFAVMDMKTKKFTKVAEPPKDFRCQSLAWSPDCKGIAYSFYREIPTPKNNLN